MRAATDSDDIAAGFTATGQLKTLGARMASGLALICFAFILWETISGKTLPGKSGLPMTLLIIFTTLATLLTLARQLPGQNVLLAAAIISVVGGIIHGVGAATGVPFGPFIYPDGQGPKLFNTLAWPIPMLWIVVVLNARGVSRLILRPWRKLRNYGFWLIGITTALVALFDLALEPFASKVNHFWMWLPTKSFIAWHGAPFTNSLGWMIGTLLMLAFATPALINKQQRSRKSPPDYHPLITYLLLLGLFATGAIVNQLWSAAVLCIVTGLVTTIFAVRGARW